jgi:16S rRNA (guanine527-N7)-methyltransferase
MNDINYLKSITYKLNTLLAEVGLPQLDSAVAARFETYLALVLRWNARINLTAVRDPDDILTRHFVESIAAAHALPAGISTLLDYGSGAGFPGIPIALCRPEIQVTLADSQAKKAAFLHEAVRTLALHAKVHSARAEDLGIQFDCVTLRAVDRMPSAVQAASDLVCPNGWLAPMTTSDDLEVVKSSAGPNFQWHPPTPLPNSTTRLLALAQRQP